MFSRHRIVLAVILLLAVFAPASSAEAGFLPGLDRVGQDEGEVYAKGCMAGDAQVHSRTCRFGDLGSSRRVVLLGDSHAAHWGGALSALGKRNGWKVIVLTRASCSAALVSIDQYCDIWRRNTMRRIRRIKPGLVLVASAANEDSYPVLRYGRELSRRASEHRLVAGMVRTLRFLKRWSGQTVLVRDQSVAPYDVTACIRRNNSRPHWCDFRPTRSKTWSYDFKAARQVSGVKLVDPEPLLCPERRCRAVDGKLLVYRNASHLAATFTRHQFGWLGRQLGDPWKSHGQLNSTTNPQTAFVAPLMDSAWLRTTVQERTNNGQPSSTGARDT